MKPPKKIPPDMRKKYANILWKRISGMRDKLIHEYHGVDLEIIWIVVKEEIPSIRAYVEQIAKELKE